MLTEVAGLGEARKRRRLDPQRPEWAQKLHAGAEARASSSGVCASTAMALSTSANPRSKQGGWVWGEGEDLNRAEKRQRGSRDNQPPPSTVRWPVSMARSSQQEKARDRPPSLCSGVKSERESKWHRGGLEKGGVLALYLQVGTV
jgi:hypothetical protein